jgi:hypothetical protein
MKVRRSVNYCREVAENPKKSKGRQSDQAAARSNLNGSSVRGGRLPTTRHTFYFRIKLYGEGMSKVLYESCRNAAKRRVASPDSCRSSGIAAVYFEAFRLETRQQR